MKITQRKSHISRNTGREEPLKAFKEAIDPDVLVRKLAIKGENRAKLRDFITIIIEELAPETKLENFFAEQFIINSWKLKRFQEIERNILNQLNSIPREAYSNGPIKHKRVRDISRISIDSASFQEISKQIKLAEQCVYQTLEKLRELKVKHK
jgi:hypothetical protein